MSADSHKYKLIIAYDGTAYNGWQIQPHSISVQETIQKALSIFLRQEIHIIGSGRTDTGVHALGQVAHFSISDEVDFFRFIASANALLPADIRIKSIEKVPGDFHAQYSAIGKIYHYHLWLDRVQDPFQRLYSTHIHEKIDLDLLKQAAIQFIGTHNFTSFANSAQCGSAARDPVRTLERLDVVPQQGGVRLEFEADGFLYKMVRNITGTLLEVAKGNMAVETIPHLLEIKDRKKAAQAAPPQGLFLMKVLYGEIEH